MKYVKKNLTEGRKLNDNMYVTCIKDMSLAEYIVAVKQHCHDIHGDKTCDKCKSVVMASKEIAEKGIVPLSALYRQCFGSLYKADKAIRRVIQLPVIIFRSFNVTEFVDRVDFLRLTQCISKYIPQQKLSTGINKESLQLLCELASTEKDRRLIRVASCQGMSANEAKAVGVSNLNEEKRMVFEAVQEYQEIKRAVNKIAQAKFDLTVTTSSSDSSGDESCVWLSGDEGNEHVVPSAEECGNVTSDNFSSVTPLPSESALLLMLIEHKLNWISFADQLKLNINNLSEQTLQKLLQDLFTFIPNSSLPDADKSYAHQSYSAFLASMQESERENQESMTDSESDNPEDWVQLIEATDECQLQNKIRKQSVILKKYRKRLIAKEMAQRCLLKRKVPKRVSRTVLKYPDIGKSIEEFARENRIGADSWRRTGILTFSGNVKRGPKLTYKRIQAHLQEKYGVQFGYGTIVQLCCVKNKRKLSAKRYFGVAKIVSKRARKGFSVKLNVDAHWSCALYKGLDFLQLKDGRDKVILNRDDAAGFRLDSTFTHKQHKVLAETGNPELTTRTDFLNKYTATLQTTSYMFLETETTPETCIGVVKAHKVHQKNPAQHASDLEMLEEFDEAKNPLTGHIDCIRVDGATDEGPSHLEVQFMWTERYIKHVNYVQW